MICAVLLQNQAQDSVVALNPAFSVTHVESPRYGGLQSILKRLKTRKRENECQYQLSAVYSWGFVCSQFCLSVFVCASANISTAGSVPSVARSCCGGVVLRYVWYFRFYG